VIKETVRNTDEHFLRANLLLKLIRVVIKLSKNLIPSLELNVNPVLPEDQLKFQQMLSKSINFTLFFSMEARYTSFRPPIVCLDGVVALAEL
jgi:hypothetical protein